jgi:hypothetical protein
VNSAVERLERELIQAASSAASPNPQ